ncbi:MAG: flagellar protein FlgN [Acetivibrionales bacterium]
MDTTIVDRLLEVLENEEELYRHLKDISDKKTKVIVEGKVSELESIIKLEQSLVVKIGKLENKREELVNLLSEELDIKPGNLTISELVKRLGQKQASKLKSCQDIMINTLNDLKNTNGLNSRLIKNSLEYIDFSINLIAAAGSLDNNYENSGNVSNSKKRNIIDARL